MTRQQIGTIEAVTAENEKVRDLAKRLRYKPTTLAACIQRTFPSLLEQNIYVLFAGECEKSVIRPQTFARLLQHFTNGQELSPADLEDREIGENLIYNKVSDIGDCIEIALSLMEKIDNLDLSTPISSKTAARLARAYGEDAADILEIVDNELHYIMDELGMRMRPMIAMTKIINAIALHAAEGEGKGENPNILSADDIIELLS